jgi:phosphoglycerate dehydrogenase-like enzyme
MAAILLAHWDVPFLSDDELDRVAALGALLDRRPISQWDDPRADELLAQADIVLGHWGCPLITADVVERAPRLGLIAYAAGTVKEVVTDAVFDRGIRVTSGAPANAEPVAEFTLAAILFAGKEAWWRRDRMRGPMALERAPREVAIGNWDRTIGIVGASLVGRRVIELLRAFPHLRVTVYDPFLTAEAADALGVTKLDLDELCATADVLSIHAPALPSTRHLIGAPQLALLRNRATVINTARGSILDHDALLAELDAGRLYAVLDVTDPEPLPDDHPLLSHPAAFVTPHLAGSEGTELARMVDDVIDEIGRWLDGAPARNEVTRERLATMA